MKMMILEELTQGCQADSVLKGTINAETLSKEFVRIYEKWTANKGCCGSSGKLTSTTIAPLMKAWAKSHSGDDVGHDSEHTHYSPVTLGRPQLLALMRVVDQDRDGEFGLDEFVDFAMNCFRDKVQGAARKVEKTSLTMKKHQQSKMVI